MQNRLCTVYVGCKHELLNIKDLSIVEVVAESKKEACEKLSINPRQYRVLSLTSVRKEVLFHTNMTNAEVIKILAQRDSNAPCEIMCDFATDHWGRDYDDIEPEDGMCYDTFNDRLFFSRGECW